MIRRASLLLALLSIAGCGGSDGDSGGSSNSSLNGDGVRTAIDVSWAGRSRALDAPSSALSATITFVGAGEGGRDVTLIADRRADPAAYTQTYAFPAEVRTGAGTLRVTFHAAAGGAGAIVAQAETGVVVRPDATLVRADGSPFGDVVNVGTVKAVTVTGPTSVVVGVPAVVTFSATDANGNVVALSPGSAQVLSGFPVDASGAIVANSIGTGQITVIVDGVRSEAFPIEARLGSSGAFVASAQKAEAIVFSPQRNVIYAATPAIGANADSIVAINPGDGSVTRVATLGSTPLALGLSDDGTALYVGLQDGGIRRVDTATGSVGPRISLGGTQAGGRRVAIDIAVVPGDANSFAVARTYVDGGQAGTDVALFRDGVEQPRTTFGYPAEPRIAFAGDPTRLFSIDNTTFRSSDLIPLTVASDGVVADARVTTLFNPGDFSPIGREGRIYGSEGSVIDTTSLSRVGRFDLGTGSGGPLIASAVTFDSAGRVVFALGQEADLRLLIFDTATFGLIGQVSLAPVAGSGGTVRALNSAGAGRVSVLLRDGTLYTVALP